MSSLNLAQIFDFANLFVLPFWALMILLPGWGVTHRVMSSYLPFAALALAYLYLFVLAFDPNTAQELANPTLSTITQFFSSELVVAAGWVHFLVLDLFVGRHIYLEGQRTGVWTLHSLVLCLFAGPLGLLSHIVTAWISQKLGPQETATEPAQG
ncbi:ABA4-like family protein [Leptolyngbya sp. FACHB-261]|uniref:ABA4-like family protein n=1 Tax=Leptolyngbya sp. FACHB-261 TaxID=2692806 RepID=UPI0016828DD8|nr:ABA4-like family protein [Leptolyngbya sp. FACHB-261]MBD2102209.1 DUF4281 domain-containing protein [Leptolyngbya sp. FACHB-261]